MVGQLLRRAAAFALLCALLVAVGAACGGSDDESGSSTAPADPATTTASSPSDGALGVDEAGAIYLGLVDNKNEAVAAASQRFEAAQLEGDLPEAAAGMGDIGRANRGFIDGLTGEEWPDAVAADIATLIEAASAEAEAADAYAQSILAFDEGTATAADTTAVANRLFAATAATLDAAGPVRRALGLPPVPGG